MLKFCISSNVNFYQETTPILIDSLLANRFRADDIHVFVGGLDKYRYYIDRCNGVHFHEVDHNSFDLTALITICEIRYYISPYWFLLHDTVKAGSGFNTGLKNSNYIGNLVTPLCDGGSMNMGIYSSKYLEVIYDDMISQKMQHDSYDSLIECKRSAIFNEDRFVKRFYNRSICERRQVLDGQIMQYESGIGRIVEHYLPLDLYKYKSNWGQAIEVNL